MNRIWLGGCSGIALRAGAAAADGGGAGAAADIDAAFNCGGAERNSAMPGTSVITIEWVAKLDHILLKVMDFQKRQRTNFS